MRALQLVGEAREVAVILRHIGDLGGGLADDLAGVGGLEFGQRLRVLGHEVGELVEQLAALRGGEAAPGLVVQRAVRGGDGAVDVGRTGTRHEGPGLGRCGIEAFEARIAILEPAVDQLLEAPHHAHLKAGSTWSMKRCSEAFLRSVGIIESIHRLNSS